MEFTELNKGSIQEKKREGGSGSVSVNELKP